MTTTTESPLLASLARFEKAPRNAEIARRAVRLEETLRKNLREIAETTATLLERLDDRDEAARVPYTIADGLSISPVGEKWAKVLVAVGDLKSLIDYATVKVAA